MVLQTYHSPAIQAWTLGCAKAQAVVTRHQPSRQEVIALEERASFGTLLKQLRKTHDLTQTELADQVGCSPSTIRMVEVGERRASKQLAELLADYFKVALDARENFLQAARLAMPGHEETDAQRKATVGSEIAIPNNLPARSTPLIGRAEEVEAITNLLLREEPRLVTLSGPPGIGKTSLAIETATQLLTNPEWHSAQIRNPKFIDGIFWVPLASVTDPEMVIPSIARILDVQDVGTEAPADTLKRFLGERHMLLLLDNFEQVVEAAPYIAELLAGCPNLKVLVTSRETLNLRVERELGVLPLALPNEEGANGDALSHNPAVALFVERAQAVDVRFLLTEENAPLVAAICTRLDGLPLAIELVAARTKMLPVKALLARLQSSQKQSHLDLLSGGARDLPDRHKTLRDAIGWSYSLLSSDEQVLFRRLGVFAGGFTLPAAEAICNADLDLNLDVLEGVSQLMHKNLLKRETTQSDKEVSEDELRFSMLVTIREYALERLTESGEADEIRLMHSEYYLAIASALDSIQPMLRNERDLFNRLDQEYDNLRLVLAWTISEGDRFKGHVDMASQLGISLAPYWTLRGRFGEGRDWLERILALHPKTLDGDADARKRRALLLYRIGILSSYLADYPHAQLRLEESLPVLQEFGLEKPIVNTLLGLGGIARLQGDYDTAEHFYRQCLEVGQALKSDWAIRNAYWVLGNTLGEQGDLERGSALLKESLTMARDAGDLYVTYLALRELGIALSYQSKYDEAISLFNEFLDLGQSAGFRVGTSVALDGMAFAVMGRGDHARAEMLYRQSLALARETDKQPIPDSLEGLAQIELARVEGKEERENLHRAATLLGAAESARRALRVKIIPVRAPVRERLISQARDRLGTLEYERFYIVGQSMSLEEAISWGLGR